MIDTSVQVNVFLATLQVPKHKCCQVSIAASPLGGTAAGVVTCLSSMQCLRPPGGLLGLHNTRLHSPNLFSAATSELAAVGWPRTVVRAAHQDLPRIPKPPKQHKAPTVLADNEGSPFHELGLKEVMDGLGRVRVRQHVNPLASKFQRPTPTVDWAKVYKDPSRPLFVDMGCGPGRFLLLLCRHHTRQQHQAMNYLGLEIREPLVERANKWCEELGMQDSVHFLFTNVSVSLAGLLENYPGPVAALAAQMPDPHFKKRHRKRRMVQPSVVQVARERLMPGGQVFLQSDVLDAVAAMRDEFEQHAGDVLELSPLHDTAPVFHWTREQEYAALAAAAGVPSVEQQQQHEASPNDATAASAGESTSGTSSGATGSEEEEVQAEDGSSEGFSEAGEGSVPFVSTWAAGGWLVDNPLGVPTERENYVLSQGGKVFRVLLVRRE